MTEPPAATRILIVDDHPLFRRGVIDALQAYPELQVVGEAGDGREALLKIGELQPDVIVTDVDMPDVGGLQLAEELLTENPSARIAILTMHQEARFLRKAADLGVLSYIVKDDSVSGIVEGISSAANGKPYVSPSLSSHALQPKSQGGENSANLGTLTRTERAVLKLVAQNRMSKEIAAELGISSRTVSTHRNNISAKLGLTHKLPLVNWALLNQDEIFELD